VRVAELVPFRHGALTIDVPQDWRDASSVAFVSPSTHAPGVPMAPGARPTGYHPNLGVSFERLPQGVASPRAYLEQTAEQLRAADVGFVELSAGELSLAGQPGWCSERRFLAGEVVCRQLCAACFLDGQLLVAAGTVAEAAPREAMEQLRAMIRSIRLDQGLSEITDRP
jgi:hypothetical protein